MDPAAPRSIRAGLPLPAGAVVGVPMDMEAAGGADKMPAGAAAAAAAPAPTAPWTRLRARLVLVLAAALYLLGCADAGLALHAMILPPGMKACAPNAERLPTASQYLVMGMLAQAFAFVMTQMALMTPTTPWSAAVLGAVLVTLVGYFLPAYNVLWLLAACDGALALVFWLMYVVMWPAAFGSLLALTFKSEIENC